MLTPTEFAEIMDYVNVNHSWDNMVTNFEEGRKIVKYVDACMDTRDGKIWCVKVKFRQITNSNLQSDYKFDNIVFTEHNCTKEKIYEWLSAN